MHSNKQINTVKLQFTTTTQSAPGKLFIAGEYAVTQKGFPAIVTSVPKHLSVTISPAEDKSVFSEQFKTTAELKCIGHRLSTTYTDYQLVADTLSVATIYITDWYTKKQQILTRSPLNDAYHLHITSQLYQDGIKYGLGSSGAVTIATLKALLSYYQVPYTPETLYKLAVIAHLIGNNNGSFGDLAASAFEKILYYEKVDTRWLYIQLSHHPLLSQWTTRSFLNDAKTLYSIIHQPWQNLVITPIILPKNWLIGVGWTQTPASTQQMVDEITNFKNSENFNQFLMDSKRCVLYIKDALLTANWMQLNNSIRYNRQLLSMLSPNIETPALTTLIEIANQNDAPAKTSGAGGGDCGICVVTNKTTLQTIYSQWQTQHITPILTLSGEALC